MHKWHRRTINKLKNHYVNDPRFLAFILVGSVARGEAGELSDIDFLLVATPEEFSRRQAVMGLMVEGDAFCEHSEGHAGGYVIDLSYLLDAAERGDERTRFQFVKAQIVFSRIPHLEQLLNRIAAYPENERIEKMKSFYSQLPLHLSFMELAEYSQNAYLLSETAVALVLFGGRLILAHNRMLYPNRKWFMREFEKAPEKPDGIIELANRLLKESGINHAQAFCGAITRYADWPQPEEGASQRIHHDSVWNWRNGAISLAER